MKALEENRPRSVTVEVVGNTNVLETLRDLETDAEAASILYREAAEAAVAPRAGASARTIELLKYAEDVFLHEPLAYPLLFSRHANLSMKRPELMMEITLIMAMAQQDLVSGPYIYSIQVLEPKYLAGVVSLDKLGGYFGGNVPPDIKSGYIYGLFLYEASPFIRSVVLESVLGSASEVEVALRNPSTLILERKRVTLGQS